jgi:hypothetical protein
VGISASLGSSALLPAGLGFRNLIMNGDFRINQRGFSSTSSTGDFGFDRWSMFRNGDGTVTMSAQTFATGNAIPNQEPRNYLRLVTSGQTAVNSIALIQQNIEDVRTLAGQTATLSFYARASSGTPKIRVTINQAFGSGGSPSSDVYTVIGDTTISTSWQRYVVTFVVPSISGKTIGTNNNHYLNLSLCTSFAGTSIGIQNNTFEFWGIQLEQNTQPTPFEQRPIGVELALCQRYYEKSYAVDTAPGTATDSGFILAMTGGAQAGSSGIHDAYVFFRVTKRGNPTVTIYDNAGNSNKCRRTAVGVANYDNQDVRDVNAYTNGVYFRSGSGSGTTNTVSCHFTAVAEL